MPPTYLLAEVDLLAHVDERDLLRCRHDDGRDTSALTPQALRNGDVLVTADGQAVGTGCETIGSRWTKDPSEQEKQRQHE